LIYLGFTTLTNGVNWVHITIWGGAAIVWLIVYPRRFDNRVQKHAERALREGTQSKTLGPCQLTISDDGLHSTSVSGQSFFKWSAIDRVELTEKYLFIFLNGPLGYPIPIADIGVETAKEAHELLIRRLKENEGR
jgi:hypothetical protein